MCNIGNNYAIMRPFYTKTSACGHPHTAKDPTVTAKDPSVTYIQRLDLKSCHVAIHFRCDTPDLAVVMWHAQRRQPQCTAPFFYTKAFCGVIYYCLVFLRLSADHVLRSSAGCCLRNGAWDAAEECTAHPDKPNHPCHCGMAGR